MTPEEVAAKQKARYQVWYQANHERQLEKMRLYARAHSKEAVQRSREWAKKNPERRVAQDIAWRTTHRMEEKIRHRKRYLEHREEILAYAKEWRLRNRDKVAANGANRRALEIMAMPPWVERAHIAAFYLEASRKSITTGIPHVVDHIWPLNGKDFNGLHVSWNLRVITKQENQQKSNRRPTLAEITGGN